jgi:hypothetical protein
MIRLSDGHRELVKGSVDPVAGGDVGDEFIMAAAKVLHEGVPGARFRADRWRLIPRIGRSRAFSRP